MSSLLRFYLGLTDREKNNCSVRYTNGDLHQIHRECICAVRWREYDKIPSPRHSSCFLLTMVSALITYLLFWTMIECGLGVIVVCLPTLRSLFGRWTLKITPGSLLSGIRNVLTLQSLSSNSEQRGSNFYAPDKMDNPPYLLSNIHSGRLEEGTVQTHIVGAGHNLEGRESVGSGIGFKREVQQFESC